MSLLDALLLEPAEFDVFISTRSDSKGSGTINDPYWGGDETKFDEIMNSLAGRQNIRVHLSDGIFKTNGYADGVGGWQIKAGWKIIGAGIDATVIRLTGATSTGRQYFAIAHALDDGTVATPVDFAEISDLTIDAAVDSSENGTNVACGAARIMGQHATVRRVRAIGWGDKRDPEDTTDTKPFAVVAVLTGVATPALAEMVNSGIQDCIAVEPSPNSRCDVNVLYVGALGDDDTTHVQPFGKSPYIRQCFVDCSFKQVDGGVVSYASSAILTAHKTDYEGGVATFECTRPHGRKIGEYIRIGSLGSFPILEVAGLGRKFSVAMSDPGSGNFACGVEFRALCCGSCRGGVIECNQVHNTWIGGPYSDALNTKEIIARLNSYKNVAVGPCWRLGRLSGERTDVSFSYSTGKVTVGTTSIHNLFPGMWVRIKDGGAIDGFQQVTKTSATTFEFASGSTGNSSGKFEILWGVDKALIEENVIELQDLSVDEIGPWNIQPQSGGRPTGVILDDTPSSGAFLPTPTFVHGDIVTRGNRITYFDGNTLQSSAGGDLGGIAMQAAGAKNLITEDNICDCVPANPFEDFRCGNVTYFNNKTPSGELIQGYNGDNATKYDELETEAEDALLLGLR